MGELAAMELARDLENEWRDGPELGVSLPGYMLLSDAEYGTWVAARILPPDFERRHGR